MNPQTVKGIPYNEYMRTYMRNRYRTNPYYGDKHRKEERERQRKLRKANQKNAKLQAKVRELTKRLREK